MILFLLIIKVGQIFQQKLLFQCLRQNMNSVFQMKLVDHRLTTYNNFTNLTRHKIIWSLSRFLRNETSIEIWSNCRQFPLKTWLLPHSLSSFSIAANGHSQKDVPSKRVVIFFYRMFFCQNMFLDSKSVFSERWISEFFSDENSTIFLRPLA